MLEYFYHWKEGNAMETLWILLGVIGVAIVTVVVVASVSAVVAAVAAEEDKDE